MKKGLAHYLSGTVTARVVSGSLPRLVSELIKSINIIAVTPDTVTLRARDYKRIRPAARRSGCLLRVATRRGLMFDFKRRRLALPFAALIAGFCAAAVFFSGRIIAVEVPPLAAPRAEVMALLNENGVRFGALRSEINERSVAREILLRFPGLSYAAVNTFEWRAELVTRPAESPPETALPPKGTVLVSAYDAIVTEVTATGGTELVKKGEVVTAGQLLVSPGVTPYAGSWARGASGSVRGLVSERVDFYMENEVETLIESGKTTELKYIKLFGRALPLGFTRAPGNANISSRTVYPTLFGVELPVEIRVDSYSEAACIRTKISPENLRGFAERALAERLAADFPGAAIHSVELSCRQNNGGWQVTAEILLERTISVSVLP